MTTRLDRAVESLARALGWWRLPRKPGTKVTWLDAGKPLSMRRRDGHYTLSFRDGASATIAAPTAALALLLADVEVGVSCPECVARGDRFKFRDWHEPPPHGPGFEWHYVGPHRVFDAVRPGQLMKRTRDRAHVGRCWYARPCQTCSPTLTDTSVTAPGRIKLTGTRLVCEAAPREATWEVRIMQPGHSLWEVTANGETVTAFGESAADVARVLVEELSHRGLISQPPHEGWTVVVKVPHGEEVVVVPPQSGDFVRVCADDGSGDPQARERLAEVVHLAGDEFRRAMFSDWRATWPNKKASECPLEPPPGRGEWLDLWLSGAKCPTCEGEGGVIEHRPTGPDDVQVWDPFPREQIAARVQATQRGARAAICQPLPEECPSCHGTGTALGHRLDALAEECERRARELTRESIGDLEHLHDPAPACLNCGHRPPPGGHPTPQPGPLQCGWCGASVQELWDARTGSGATQ